MKIHNLIFLFCFSCLLNLQISEARHTSKSSDTSKNMNFLLDFFYKPGICKMNSEDPACDKLRNGNIISLHGLWPIKNNFPNAKQCSFFNCTNEKFSVSEAGQENVEKYRTCSSGMSVKFVEHEWSKHGTCSNMSQKQFIETSVIAYQKYKDKITEALSGIYGQDVSLDELLHQINLGKSNSIRVSCKTTKKGETKIQYLQELSIMIDFPSLNPVSINCPEIVNNNLYGTCKRDIPIHITSPREFE